MVIRHNSHPVDVYVGIRLRHKRDLCGLTQSTLGKRTDISFQQIQKYESGKNRIGCSRLYDFAQALETSVSYFFDGFESWAMAHGYFNYALNPSVAKETLADNRERYIAEPPDPLNEESVALIKAFRKIDRQDVRLSVLKLVRGIADGNIILQENNDV